MDSIYPIYIGVYKENKEYVMGIYKEKDIYYM